MKATNYFILFLIGVMGIIKYAHGQNSIWSLPPYYVENNGSPNTPTSLPTFFENKSASNIQLDFNGDILFYIVDNDVFDSDGQVIDNLISSYKNSHLPHHNICMGLANTSEIVIIPDPSNCNRYYIITSAETLISCNTPYVNPMPNAAEPYVAILDFNLERPDNPSKYGAISSIERLVDVSSVPSPYSWSGTDLGGILFASSKLRNDNGESFRYLFVSYTTVYPSYDKGIVRFKIGDNGVVYDGFIPFEVQNATGGLRSEMELFELPNGRFRIACPYRSMGTTHNGRNLAASIYVAELDASGNVFSNNEKTLYFYSNDNNSSYEEPFVRGLEFSPDGSKLFITHDISEYHNKPFEYYDFNTPNTSDPNGNGIYSLDINSGTVNEEDFQNSQIELAVDGKIYLGANERLASLSDPNNPSATNFIDSVIALPGYQANYGSIIEEQWTKLYTLPDQIDGMNYEDFSFTVYNEIIYNVHSSDVWELGVGNNPWDSSRDIYIKERLTISSGKDLTIKGMTFRFAPGAIVTIEQGAKLTIDNTTFTNTRPCNNEEFFWDGIQVYGTTNQHQYPASNPTYQGMLVVTNGGVIENANRGVTNWNEGNWHEIGGVIQVTDGFFRNNRKDVEFISYQNFIPNNPSSKVGNTSYFRNTSFISDDDFIEKGLAILPHVTLWDVNGISFQNCHFANEVSNINNTASNRGIYSIDAGYYVTPRCTTIQPIGVPCPTGNLLKSSFEGFEVAIEATGAGTSETVTIQQADFIDNVRGVVIDEFDNVSINRNNFEVGNGPLTPIIATGTGIAVGNSSGYVLEENNISSNLTNGFHMGIIIHNSGTDDNRVYKNTIKDFTFGLIGDGINHNSNYQKGLQFLCNSLTNNQEAIRISSNVTTDGVRFYQGEYSPKKSAGNTFANNTMDISNLSNSIVYMHNGGNTEPLNYQGLITLEGSSSVNYCPSSFGGLILMGGDLALDSLGSRLDDLTTSYNDLNFVYTSLIDDGNTEEFKDNIELNWSSDAWLLRGKLLESSPYLSSEVLLEAAKQNVLPNGMLLEILLANPDATRSERFVEELKMVTQNSFPEYMLDYVRGNWDNRTLRTDMEGQLSSIHSELSNTRNWIKHLTKTKEEYKYEDRLNVVKLGDEIYSKVGLIDFFIENNEFNKADSVLNVIQNDKKYRHDLLLIENFGEYINFRSSLDNRNLAQLDSTEIAYLQDLAEYNGRVAGYAQNILCFFYDICFEKELVFEEPKTKSNMVLNSKSEELNNILYNVNIYPNPAADYTSIQWEIFDELRDAHYRVLDLNGRELLTGALTSNKGEEIIDTRKLGQGVYIIGIYNNQQLMVNKKLVVEGRK